MALIVEDGTGKPDAESYVDVAFVDAYHLKRNNAAWVGSTAEKEGWIIASMDYLRQYVDRWKGDRYSPQQALDWPRWNVTRSDIYSGYVLPPSPLPVELKNAVAELSVRAISGELLPDYDPTVATKVISETVGPISVTYADSGSGGSGSSSPTYKEVDIWLNPLLHSPDGIPIYRS